jgi:hypothetical protein
MRHYLLALLPLLACATPSSAQQPRPDTLVCFTLEEAGVIHDSLWAASRHRDKVKVYRDMVRTLDAMLTSAERREALERKRADSNLQALTGCATRSMEIDELQRKVRQRGRLFGGGLVLGGAVTFLLTELW